MLWNDGLGLGLGKEKKILNHPAFSRASHHYWLRGVNQVFNFQVGTKCQDRMTTKNNQPYTGGCSYTRIRIYGWPCDPLILWSCVKHFYWFWQHEVLHNFLLVAENSSENATILWCKKPKERIHTTKTWSRDSALSELWLVIRQQLIKFNLIFLKYHVL